jgi:hypothetical protein
MVEPLFCQGARLDLLLIAVFLSLDFRYRKRSASAADPLSMSFCVAHTRHDSLGSETS